MWYAQYLIALLKFRWRCPSTLIGVLVAVVYLSWFRLAWNFHPITSFWLRARHLRTRHLRTPQPAA